MPIWQGTTLAGMVTSQNPNAQALQELKKKLRVEPLSGDYRQVYGNVPLYLTD